MEVRRAGIHWGIGPVTHMPSAVNATLEGGLTDTACTVCLTLNAP